MSRVEVLTTIVINKQFFVLQNNNVERKYFDIIADMAH